jgi:hypothetical protein
MEMRTQLLAVFLTLSGAAFGGDWEFEHIVKAVESRYAANRTHIPLMGVANLFVKVAHPAGASGFKLAVFEHLNGPRDYSDLVELDRFMKGLCVNGLHSLVRVHSRRGAESSTYIFAGDVRKTTNMLIATFGRTEATVIQVKVNRNTLLQSLQSSEGGTGTFIAGRL